MNTPMHFRKRQLLEYQMEASSSYSNQPHQTHIDESTSFTYAKEPQIPFEYPPSPSSIISEKSTTPTQFDNNIPSNQWINEYENSPQQMENLSRNTVALMKMENVSPISSTDVHKLTQIAEALKALENSRNGSKLTYDTPTLVQIAYELKETIGEYINQQITNTSTTNSSLSTLILAKLNQLRANAQLQTPIQLCPGQFSYHNDRTYYTPEPELLPEDLSMKQIKEEDQTSPEEDFGESNLVIVEPDFHMHSDHDDYHDQGISSNSNFRYSYNRQGLHQMASRISGIFSFINRTQMRMEDFMRRGINVYEKVANTKRKSKKKSSKSSKKPKKSSSSSSSPSMNRPRINPRKPAGVLNLIPWSNGRRQHKNSTPMYPIPSPYDDSLVIIGPKGTTISKEAWSKIDWKLSPPAVTRKILMNLFDREFLSTHSLTGRPSPAFLDLNKPEKKPLDSNIVADVVELVTSRTIATPKEVRMAITTKCADECKMRRWREMKQISNNEKENCRIRPY